MNFLLVLGVALSLIGHIWSMQDELHRHTSVFGKDYWRFTGRSQTVQDIIRTTTGILMIGGYLLIIFSSNNYVTNILLVLFLHFLAFPFAWTILSKLG